MRLLLRIGVLVLAVAARAAADLNCGIDARGPIGVDYMNATQSLALSVELTFSDLNSESLTPRSAISNYTTSIPSVWSFCSSSVLTVTTPAASIHATPGAKQDLNISRKLNQFDVNQTSENTVTEQPIMLPGSQHDSPKPWITLSNIGAALRLVILLSGALMVTVMVSGEGCLV